MIISIFGVLLIFVKKDRRVRRVKIIYVTVSVWSAASITLESEGRILVLSFDINFLCAGLIWNLGDRGAFLLVLGPPIKRDGYVRRYKTGASEALSVRGGGKI